MSVIRWLHISDLHLNKSGVETNRLRDKLPKYLRSLALKCDYVFCTGDLRYAPDGNFSANTVMTIKAICDAIGTPIDHFFIVPGNHDVELNKDGRDKAIKSIWFRHETEEGYYSPKVGEINASDLAQIKSGLESYYNALQPLFEEQHRTTQFHARDFGLHKVVETEDLNIVLLDSTISYTKHQDHNLIVGTEYLQQALGVCNSKKPVVILTHYSFDSLDRSEQEQCTALLQDANVRLWLSGHEHMNLARKQRDFFYEFQSGALLLETGVHPCVLLGELDTQSLEGHIQAHYWFSPHGWAIYPLIAFRGNRSRYQFSLAENFEEVESTTTMQRRTLRATVLRYLEENQNLFETYGPTEINRASMRSEAPSIWERMIRERIIPNSQELIQLLEDNHFLLSSSEYKILLRYKAHIVGFQANHMAGSFILDAPRFPNEIFTILT